MFKGTLVFFNTYCSYWVSINTAIRATIMAFKGDTDDFFSRIWDKFVEYFGYTLVTIIMFFPYIIGPIIVIIFILI